VRFFFFEAFPFPKRRRLKGVPRLLTAFGKKNPTPMQLASNAPASSLSFATSTTHPLSADISDCLYPVEVPLRRAAVATTSRRPGESSTLVVKGVANLIPNSRVSLFFVVVGGGVENSAAAAATAASAATVALHAVRSTLSDHSGGGGGVAHAAPDAASTSRANRTLRISSMYVCRKRVGVNNSVRQILLFNLSSLFSFWGFLAIITSLLALQQGQLVHLTHDLLFSAPTSKWP
jgi:hypothetical protein